MKKRFGQILRDHIDEFLLLRDATAPTSQAQRWQLSALRIILVFGLLLESTIFLHSSWEAAQVGLYDIIGMVLVFFVLLSGTLYLTSRSLKLGAWSLILIVYAAGFCIATAVSITEIAKLGIIFIYTSPLIALILLGRRPALVFMGLNLLPFFLLIRNQPVPNFMHLSATLAGTHTYIQSLIFLFFNICIPLAFSRVLSSLNRATRHAQKMNQTLETSLAIHEEVFEHNGSATLFCQQNGIILRCNRLAGQLLGLAPAQVETLNLHHLLKKPAAPTQDHAETIQAVTVLEGIWQINKNARPVLLQVTPMAHTGNLIIAMSDLSEIQQLRTELSSNLDRAHFLARHDGLTSLPNRSHFIEILNEQIVKARQSSKPLTVLNIKIRNLRTVNTRYGIVNGDNLINQIGHCIHKQLSANDRLGRTRGGVFSLLLANLPQDSNTAQEHIARYTQALPRQHAINGQTIEVSYFIGAASFPQDAGTAQDLIRFSELALHNARSDQSDDPVYFDHIRAAAVQRRIDIEVGLRKALREHSLTLFYQPKVDCHGSLQGLEALVRWQSPELGSVSPAEFIPVAENSGMVHDVTLQVIEMVIRQIKNWQDKGVAVTPIAINLSAIDLSVPTLVHEILSRTDLLDLSVNLLEFEITETALMVNGETGLHNLQKLQELGFRISIDDFGSGYSSLSKIANMPVYAIKIDREFVQDIPGDIRREKIIHGILSLAHSLDLSIVAEGVENAQQLEFLHMNGCHTFQGFFFHRPLDVAATEKLLTTQLKHTTSDAGLNTIPCTDPKV